jgi:hypothetical protein
MAQLARSAFGAERKLTLVLGGFRFCPTDLVWLGSEESMRWKAGRVCDGRTGLLDQYNDLSQCSTDRQALK